jgi:cyclic beta-1,2-glucan synthetase
MFGLRQEGNEISFKPCLPSHWDRAELTLRREGRTLRVIFCRDDATHVAELLANPTATSLIAGHAVRWDQLAAQNIRLLNVAAAQTATSSQDARDSVVHSK